MTLSPKVVGNVALVAFLAMVKIFCISLVGILFAKYPKDEPLLTTSLLKKLSKISNLIFLPALIVSSLGKAVNVELLTRIGSLMVFAIGINLISYILAHTIGRVLMRDTPQLFAAVAVAVGSPNAISMPLLVMQSLCEEESVNSYYKSSSSLCFAEATSMLFVYSIGWHLFFWTYGFPQLKSIADFQPDGVICEDAGNKSQWNSFFASLYNGDYSIILGNVGNYKNVNSKQEVATKSRDNQNNLRSKLEGFTSYMQQVLCGPSMLAIYIGLAVGLIPSLQRALFKTSSSPLRPLGAAITTLGDPVVAVNCLVMSASLAHVGSTAETPDSKVPVTSTTSTTSTAAIVNPLHVEEDNESRSDAKAEGTSSLQTLPQSNAPQRPSWRAVVVFLLCRLILPPLIFIPILSVCLQANIVSHEEKLMQLILVVESATASAQMIVVCLNQIGLSQMASKISYLYVFQYSASVFTMTFWVTVAMSMVYG